MRELRRRLARLERHLRTMAKDNEGDSPAALLEARRLKRGLPRRDPTLTDQLRGISLAEILNSSRAKANLIVCPDGEIPPSRPEAPAVRPSRCG